MIARTTTKSVCARRGCDNRAAARGYCSNDFFWARRLGITPPYPRLPGGTVIPRLIELTTTYGWRYDQVGERCDMDGLSLRNIVRGRTKTVRTDVAEAILAIPLEPAVSGKSCDPTGTRRRIEALRWMGWPVSYLAGRLGLTREYLNMLSTPGWAWNVTFKTRAEVAALYDELSGTFGPSKSTRTRAIKRGFAPPLAWDDETIEDPKRRPRGVLAAAA